MNEQLPLFDYDEHGNPHPRPDIHPARPAPGQRHSKTSMAAARLVDRTHALSQVYYLLLGCLPDGLTDEEGQEMLQMSGNTYRPRRVELEEVGLVVDSKTTRKTRAKRQAVVWLAVPMENL